MIVNPPSISVITAVAERCPPEFPMTFGTLHILRVLRQLPVKQPVSSAVRTLTFKGAPFSRQSKATGMRLSFVEEPQPPMPAFDITSGIIDLFYPIASLAEVQDLLRSGKERFCYYWRSSDGLRCRAWLMASP
ncbi:MAG: hypothetical protein ABI599_14475 [Flavobacteriales bacterium]